MTSEQKLKYAVILFSLDLMFSFIWGLISPHILHTTRVIGPISQYVLPIINAIIYAVVIWQISLKRNWARLFGLVIFIVLLISTLISFAFPQFIMRTFTQMTHGADSDAMVVAFVFIPNIIQRVLEAIAVYFLFSKGMNKLFEAKPKTN